MLNQLKGLYHMGGTNKDQDTRECISAEKINKSSANHNNSLAANMVFFSLIDTIFLYTFYQYNVLWFQSIHQAILLSQFHKILQINIVSPGIRTPYSVWLDDFAPNSYTLNKRDWKCTSLQNVLWHFHWHATSLEHCFSINWLNMFKIYWEVFFFSCPLLLTALLPSPTWYVEKQ